MAEREAILLVRLDGVGDAALCIPSLEGLRRAFPDGTFGAVCSSKNASLYSNLIAHIVTYDPALPPGSIAEELRSTGYTKAMIATEEVAGYQIARLAGSPERAGFWHRLHKPFKSLWQRLQVTRPVYRPAARTKSPEHEVESLYRLARALGAPENAPSDAASLRPWLRIEASPESQRAHGAIGFQISPKLIGSGFGPATLADAIAEVLSQFPDRRVVLIASDADEDLACAIQEYVTRATSSDRIRVVSGLSLPQWVGLLSAIDVLVTPDTGAAHVAGILGNKIIDIFDDAQFERLSAQWRPWAGTWRCHAKPNPMKAEAAAYGRFLASEIRALDDPRLTPSPAILHERA